LASRVAAAKMGFFTKEKSTVAGFAGDDVDDDGNTITEAAPGTFQELPAGMDFKAFDPEHPTANFAAFTKSVLRGVCAGLNVSYTGLSGDLEAVNYSSIRAGLLDERDAWRALQYWMIQHFCRPVFADWLWMALLSGEIALPAAKYEKFLAATFRPRGWSWVDPEKDADASQKAIAAALTTHTDVLADQGKAQDANRHYRAALDQASGIPQLPMALQEQLGRARDSVQREQQALEANHLTLRESFLEVQKSNFIFTTYISNSLTSMPPANTQMVISKRLSCFTKVILFQVSLLLMCLYT
jgi:lambda family phage portal protein